MKAFLVLMMSFALSAAQSVARADKFKVDGAHSAVEFKVRHLYGTVKGKFKVFEGEFNFDENKPEASSGKMTIKTASIDTGTEKRDEHLKSPDFFDVQKFDTITFVSKKMVKKSGDKFKLEGDMTLKGVTKPVTFDVKYLGTLDKDQDPSGNKRATFEASTKINRNDFGLSWNKDMTDKNPESTTTKMKKFLYKKMLGEEVDVDLNIEAVAEPAA